MTTGRWELFCDDAEDHNNYTDDDRSEGEWTLAADVLWGMTENGDLIKPVMWSPIAEHLSFSNANHLLELHNKEKRNA